MPIDIYISQASAFIKCKSSNACHRVWYRDRGQANAVKVFVNNFISAVYGLKGRKVMPRILKKPKKINI